MVQRPRRRNGISYYAMTQWLAASLKPPSLKAMIPWEGAADMYREFGYHGGIFSFGFVVNWYNNHMAHHLLGKPQAAAPDAFATPWVWEYMHHNLDSDWYHGRRPAVSEHRLPALQRRQLERHGPAPARQHRGLSCARPRSTRSCASTPARTTTPFYTKEGREDQLRFLDHWLKGKDTGIMKEPPVKLLIRKGGAGNYEWRQEKEWPLARTKWTRFYLGKGVLTEKAGKAASISYPASGMTKAGVASASWTSTALAGSLPDMGVYFVTKPMKKNLEITGPIVLVLWVSSSTEDMDVFATLRNIGPDGKDVFELGQQQQPVPVAKGWLRASHRTLDEKLSLPWRPYHSHQNRVFLEKNQVVKLEVEIWPTSMVFAKGHRIRLDVQPRDGIGSAPYTHYSADYNSGTNTIYAGGSRASHLLLPVIPS